MTHPHVVSVVSPYTNRQAVSEDGTIGYAPVALDKQSEAIPTEDAQKIIDTAQQAGTDGLRVELSGDPVRAARGEDSGSALRTGRGRLERPDPPSAITNKSVAYM